MHSGSAADSDMHCSPGASAWTVEGKELELRLGHKAHLHVATSPPTLPNKALQQHGTTLGTSEVLPHMLFCSPHQLLVDTSHADS
jgi:hypothetical protein